MPEGWIQNKKNGRRDRAKMEKIGGQKTIKDQGA